MQYNEPVGISILTNGTRLPQLQECIRSFLASCYYRPLKICILDNGSSDGTDEFCKHLSDLKTYGVTFRYIRFDQDQGCAVGTNQAIQMVNDCQYALHLESDFVHLPEEVSGRDKMWLHRALNFMETGECDYLYLRRMRNEVEMRMHWWSQWMPQITEERDGEYLKCPGFWWSNNPSLRRVKALYASKTLPLNEFIDGPKGTPGWSKPELTTPKPPNAWIHKWGVFIHDPGVIEIEMMKQQHGTFSCGKKLGTSWCKYGFFINPGFDNTWCNHCRGDKNFRDMAEHDRRVRG